MKHVKIYSSKKTEYKLFTYCQKEKYYVLLDALGKITVIDFNGEIRNFKHIDK